MSEYERQLRDTLAKAVELLNTRLNCEHHTHEGNENIDVQGNMVCTPKSLPKRLLVKAAETARNINPANAPLIGPGAAALLSSPLPPEYIVVLTTKYWGPAPRHLTVSFMEATPADLRARIISHMNAWNRTAGIDFVETQGTGQVRISRGSGGFWSFLGTDILH